MSLQGTFLFKRSVPFCISKERDEYTGTNYKKDFMMEKSIEIDKKEVLLCLAELLYTQGLISLTEKNSIQEILWSM